MGNNANHTWSDLHEVFLWLRQQIFDQSGDFRKKRLALLKSLFISLHLMSPLYFDHTSVSIDD